MSVGVGGPRHVGLVGDGVRRWARSHGVELLEAYERAMENVATVVEFFFEQGAEVASLYLLSRDNLSRPAGDLEAALKGEERFLRTTLRRLVEKWECDVHHAGRDDLLPETYVEAIRALSVREGRKSGRVVNLLAAYCPWDELRHAMALCPGDVRAGLWVGDDVDLVIRTSGERRTSNFLPLQCGYAELFFVDRHINDIGRDDCGLAIEWFRSRRRRFGR